MSEICHGVGDAMLAGLRLGQRKQQQNTLQSWIDYATDLEVKLQQTQQSLENAERMKDVQGDVLRSMEIVLERVEHENKEIKSEMSEEAAKHAKYVRSLMAELEDLREIASKAKALSINATALQALEELYLQELKATEDPSKFSSLSFEARAKAMGEAILEFKRSGKIVADVPKPDIMPLGFPK